MDCCKLPYVSFMVTTKQKSIVDTKKRKECKYIATENHKITKKAGKHKGKKEPSRYTRARKQQMAMSTYLTII